MNAVAVTAPTGVAPTGPTRVALTGARPEDHTPHRLHAPGRNYREANCYVDVLVELLHARGLEPLSVLGCTLRLDFEGDQFTFFKPTPQDLEELLGVDVHEFQPYRPMPGQLEEQLRGDRTLVLELDAYYLPDTQATDYRRAHVKTSVAVEAIDPVARRLTYFHNAGLHELAGDDYDGVFRLGDPVDAEMLPGYVELVRFDAGEALTGQALRAAAREHTREHLRRRPSGNPFRAFGDRLPEDLPRLLAGDSADFHAYAFATVRMAGAACELGADHVDWLQLGLRGDHASAALREIVEGCKVLSFRLARRRPFEPAERIAVLADAWDYALAGVARGLG